MERPPAHHGHERAKTAKWLRASGVAIIVLALGFAGYLLLRASNAVTTEVLDGASDEELQSATDPEGRSVVAADDGTSDRTTPEGPTSSPGGVTGSGSSMSSSVPSTVTSTMTSTSESTTTTSSTTSTASGSTSSQTSTVLTTEANTRPAIGNPDPMTAPGPAGTGCNTAAGSIPDGVWFGFIGGWTDPTIGFDVVCLYGGGTARSLADERQETMRPGRVWYAVDDDGYNTETITVAANARAAEVIDQNGNAGPSVPWADAITRLDLLDGVGATMAWVHIKDGQVIEASVAPWSLVHPSIVPPEPNRSRCSNNGLPPGTRLEVFGVPADRDGGRLPLRYEPDPEAPIIDWLENGSHARLVYSCVLFTEATHWWGVDYEGAVAWTLGEFLRQR